MKKLVLHLFLGAFCLQGICQTTDSFKDFTMTDGFNVIELANKIMMPIFAVIQILLLVLRNVLVSI